MEWPVGRLFEGNDVAASADEVKRSRRRHVQSKPFRNKIIEVHKDQSVAAIEMVLETRAAQTEALDERLCHPDEQRTISEQVRWTRYSLRRERDTGSLSSTQERPKQPQDVVDLIYYNKNIASDSLVMRKNPLLRTKLSSKSSLLFNYAPFQNGCAWPLVLALVCVYFTCNTLGYQLTNNLIANNLPPKFITSPSVTGSHQASNSEIVVRVKEGPGSIGRLIYTLKGEDPDDDPLTFGVMGSTASDLLRIENIPANQANVFLRKELDRETTESYTVVITLTDGKLGRGNWVSARHAVQLSRDPSSSNR